jgi:membrane protein implicated in regulation of membrane protease activity
VSAIGQKETLATGVAEPPMAKESVWIALVMGLTIITALLIITGTTVLLLLMLAIFPMISGAVMFMHVAGIMFMGAIFTMLITNLVRTMTMSVAIHILRKCRPAANRSQNYRNKYEFFHDALQEH